MESKYNITISDASKDGEIVKFTVQTKTKESDESEGGKIVLRQYEDFEYLLHCLTTRNDTAAIIIPSLPPKPAAVPANAESKVNVKQNVSRTIGGDEYYKDCKQLQKFIQEIASHPLFQDDENLKKFLTDEEPPVRAAVKRGLLDSFVSIVDNARFQHHKDVDDEFQKRRDNTNGLLLNMKQCHVNKGKMLAAENSFANHLGTTAMTARNSATVDTQNSKILTRFLGQFSDVLDELQLKSEKTSFLTDDTAGSIIELYARNLQSCQDMLFRRTCKLVESENATKALEKAKPKNRQQLLTAKEDADKVFEELSDKAGTEFERFTEQRIQSFQTALIELADRHIENHQDTCELLKKAITELKDVA